MKEKNKKVQNQRPPCHFIKYGKQVVYFEFLKHLIDIPFVKLALELPLCSKTFSAYSYSYSP